MHVRRERLFVALFLLFQSLTLARFVRYGWEVFFKAQGVVPNSNVAPYAPDVYRLVAPALLRRLPLSMPAAAELCAFVFVWVALYLLYRLATDGVVSDRLVVVGLFLACVHFPLVWFVPQQRPETALCCLYVAVVLYFLRRRLPLAVLAATVVQGFTRSDLAVVLGLGVLLVGFRHRDRSNIFTGSLMVALGAGIQLYLQLVRYPHLSYPPGVQPVQLLSNLHPHNLHTFFIAMAPVLLVAFLAVRQGVDVVSEVVLVASGLYGCVWWAVGSTDEVRIFVPLMFAMCVVASKALAGYLAQAPLARSSSYSPSDRHSRSNQDSYV